MKKITQPVIAIVIFFFFSSFKINYKPSHIPTLRYIQQQTSYIDFTLNGTKYHFGDKQIGYGPKPSLVYNDSIRNLEEDTNNITSVEIAGSTTDFPVSIISIMAGNAKDTVINGKRITYGIQINTPYKITFFSFRNTKNIAEARANQSKVIMCECLQISFSAVSMSHVAGTFSGALGTNGDSTITDGKFNVFAKRE